jgi:biopolymer transport protein ExbD
MNLRPGHKEDSVEVNLTPLIDVVFLLLIFFMVSTTFDRHAKLKVSLPEASTKATQQQNDPFIH